jgi:hypothetical protein
VKRKLGDHYLGVQYRIQTNDHGLRPRTFQIGNQSTRSSYYIWNKIKKLNFMFISMMSSMSKRVLIHDVVIWNFIYIMDHVLVVQIQGIKEIWDQNMLNLISLMVFFSKIIIIEYNSDAWKWTMVNEFKRICKI